MNERTILNLACRLVISIRFHPVARKGNGQDEKTKFVIICTEIDQAAAAAGGGPQLECGNTASHPIKAPWSDG